MAWVLKLVGFPAGTASDSVVDNDAVDAIETVLHRYPVLDRPVVVPEVQLPARLYARKNPRFDHLNVDAQRVQHVSATR